jgi:hypothetical protein
MAQFDLKKNLKNLLTASLFLVFLSSLITGLIKFPEFQKFFSYVFNYTSVAKISWLHDFSGLALIILIVIHLIMKRKGLKEAFVSGYEIPKKIIYVLVGAVLVFAVGIYFSNNYFSVKRTTTLSAVEIKDYQGEKLGSINDFRENSIKGPQYVDKDKYVLMIDGLVSAPRTYTYDDVAKLPSYQKTVTINCVEGWSVRILWEGVLVKDLLKDLTIKPEAKTIIFYAVDGYSTSFPLNYIFNNNIIMAEKMNGVVLPPERGFPFQLVAEQKWGYKWIKWINRIELSNNTDYKGFWESRGYNNDGDFNGSKFSQ